MSYSAPEILAADLEPSPITVALRIVGQGTKPRLVLVDREQFTIGSAEQCDLQMPGTDMPLLHSVVHVQGKAVWIEAVDEDAMVTMEQGTYRRRALRDGDRLLFDEMQITVQIGEPVSRMNPLPVAHSPRLASELSALSAEELCDRIELEEAQLDAFEQRRSYGWQALMSAMREVVAQDSARSPERIEAAQVAAISDEKFEDLINHVRELSETLDERTKVLEAQESLLLESSSQLCESQVRVSRQLEQLLERIIPGEHPSELRASA